MRRYLTDREVIEGLRESERSCIEFLYREFTPIIRHYLKNNSGNLQDVEDLFQDSLIVLYNRCKIKPFILECSLKTFFYAICKKIWLQRLERKYRLWYKPDCCVYENKGEYNIEDQFVEEELLEQQRIYYKHLMLMPRDCNRILQLYCLRVSYKEIARLLNFKNEVYVKTRKYFCKNLLRKRIMSDPEYYQFINSNG